MHCNPGAATENETKKYRSYTSSGNIELIKYQSVKEDKRTEGRFKYSGTLSFKLNLFQRAVREVICLKTKSFFPRFQHERVVGSRTEVLLDN